MRLRSLATLIVFFLLAAMISHSMTSTMVLGVTPVILSKRGVVAQPDVTNDAQRINTIRRMAAPSTQQTEACLSSLEHDRCIARATDDDFRHARIVNVLVAPVQHTGTRHHPIGLQGAAVGCGDYGNVFAAQGLRRTALGLTRCAPHFRSDGAIAAPCAARHPIE